MSTVPHFDAFADRYDAELNASLSITGEDKKYFANRRLQWLWDKLELLDEHPHSVLDYGCSTGDTCQIFASMPGIEKVLGVDISSCSIEIAKRQNSSQKCAFSSPTEYVPEGPIDIAYCNGVFHHIPVHDRAVAVKYIYSCLKFGGIFAFWENNPWSPATRFVMSRCAFDEDAITITTAQATSLLRRGGFEILRIDYLFFFPRFLSMFRSLEPALCSVPLGGQYLVLCRKPRSDERQASSCV